MKIDSSLTSVPSAEASCAVFADPLIGVLEQLRSLVARTTQADYVAQADARFLSATIGGHVRHCLDHVAAIVGRDRDQRIDYDHRERGTSVETDPVAGLAELQRLIAGVVALRDIDGDCPVEVMLMPDRRGQSVAVRSSLARELAFALSHTIHHQATVRGMAMARGISVDNGFGYAPSTLSHRDTAACAR
jgi:hypothetical protein